MQLTRATLRPEVGTMGPQIRPLATSQLVEMRRSARLQNARDVPNGLVEPEDDAAEEIPEPDGPLKLC